MVRSNLNMFSCPLATSLSRYKLWLSMPCPYLSFFFYQTSSSSLSRRPSLYSSLPSVTDKYTVECMAIKAEDSAAVEKTGRVFDYGCLGPLAPVCPG